MPATDQREEPESLEESSAIFPLTGAYDPPCHGLTLLRDRIGHDRT